MLFPFIMCLWIVVIFRTNGAIIKGFEEDVGSRTTHYTFSTNTLMNSMLSYAGDGYRGPPVSKVSTETKHLSLLSDNVKTVLSCSAAPSSQTGNAVRFPAGSRPRLPADESSGDAHPGGQGAWEGQKVSNTLQTAASVLFSSALPVFNLIIISIEVQGVEACCGLVH